jgi:hypothetical protein
LQRRRDLRACARFKQLKKALVSESLDHTAM